MHHIHVHTHVHIHIHTHLDMHVYWVFRGLSNSQGWYLDTSRGHFSSLFGVRLFGRPAREKPCAFHLLACRRAIVYRMAGWSVLRQVDRPAGRASDQTPLARFCVFQAGVFCSGESVARSFSGSWGGRLGRQCGQCVALLVFQSTGWLAERFLVRPVERSGGRPEEAKRLFLFG